MMTIGRVAVLGAGTMGARIAAHFANAGAEALALDVTEEAARKGIEAARKQSPGAFFTEKRAGLVTPLSFEDGMGRLGEADWVIEAVVEDLAVKRELWGKVTGAARGDAILSTNTSGIPLRAICEGWAGGARRRFLGTHFFNPPRYLHLLELIPGPETDAGLMEKVAEYGERSLGKGVVVCKDTPNFIANRIGAFFGAATAKLMVELDLTVEEVDALTGPLVGLPKSAAWRLLDIVGLDVWQKVMKNLYELVPDDPSRERFQTPEFMEEMIRRGWLGQKSGQGFYKRVGPEKEIHAIDWKTLEYHPAAKVKMEAVEQAKVIEDLDERVRALAADTGKAGRFVRTLFEETWRYAAERQAEIAHSAEDIDRAMQWGYGHTHGPFEMAGVLGWTGRAPAPAKGAKEIRRNAGASLADLGDGCVQLEFHSKMNALGADAIGMIHEGVRELEKNFEAMVVGNEGENFSAGANLMLILMAAQEAEWDELDEMVRAFQGANMAMKLAKKPVVAAPHKLALGGGCEVVLHAARVQAQAELYMGLVEIGVGVIPAGGGCKEMVLRMGQARRAFELIALSKVSASAEHAKELGLLEAAAGITMNPRRLLEDAKREALALARHYRPRQMETSVMVGGDGEYAALRMGAWLMKEAGHISEHEFVMAEKLARIVTGGQSAGPRTVSEQHLLDLEREAFLSLCGMAKTQERMSHMLKTGKALRN